MLQYGETAFYWAASMGYTNIVQMLIDYGAADLGKNKVSKHCERNSGYGFVIVIIIHPVAGVN